jgi:archaemetzincin
MIKKQTPFFSFLIIITLSFAGCKNSTKKIFIGTSKENNFTVAILPYENFDTSLLQFVQKETEEFYHCKTIVLRSSSLPQFAFYAPRNRYKADSLLDHETGFLTNNIDAIAGLTVKDISTSKEEIKDWGVFGLGRCPGKVCVISIYRLARASNTVARLKERLIKVVLHEIGHNLGLPHCTNNKECLMTDAGGTIRQVDNEKKWLCEKCQFKLAH